MAVMQRIITITAPIVAILFLINRYKASFQRFVSFTFALLVSSFSFTLIFIPVPLSLSIRI